MTKSNPILEKAKILIVDDELIIASDIQNLTERLGFQVTGIAEDATEAWKLVEQELPDLILMDIRLRGKTDGITLSEEILKKYDIPIVFITAFADKETLERAKKIEPYSYLTKPFNTRDLHSAIEIALYKHSIGKKLRESEARLKKSEALLNKSQKIAKVGGWEWDIASQTMYWTDECYRIHDMEPGEVEPGTPEHIKRSLMCYPSNEREKIQKAFELCCQEGTPYSLELLFLTYKGRELWVQTTGEAVYEDGKITKVIGNILDITERKRAEAHNQLLAAMLDTAPSSITVHNNHGEFLYANQKTFELHDFTRDEFFALNLQNLDVPESAELIEARIKKIAEAGEASFESHHYRKNGSSFPLHILAKTVSWNNNPAILSIATDISEQKASEQALLEREAEIRSIFRSAPVGIGMLRNRVFSNINPQFTEITGYSKEEVIGKNARLLYPTDEDYDYVGREKYAQIQNYGTGTVESRWQRKDGKVIDILLSSTPIDPQDLEKGVTFAALDITERKAVLEALKASRERLREAESIGKMGHVDWIVAEQRSHWSDEIFRIYERDPKLGVPGYSEIMTLHKPEHAALLEKAVINALEHGKDYNLDLIALMPSGKEKHLQIIGKAIKGPDGKVTNIKGTVQDITERKLAEEQLIKFKQIVSSTTDGISLLDKSYRYIFVNDAYEKYSGKKAEEFIGFSISEYLGEELFLRDIKPKFDQCLKGETVKYQEWIHYSAIGKRFVEITYYPYINTLGAIDGVVANTQDITERKLAEETLRESEERFQKMLSLVPDMISIHDPEMNIIYSNWNGFAAVPEDKRIRNTKCYKTYRDLDEICPDCQAENVLKTKKTIQKEVKLPEGIWIDLRVIPLLRKDGSVEFFMEWVRDISEQKEAENALRQSEARYASLFQEMMDGFALHEIITDGTNKPIDYRFLSVNPAFEKMTGLKAEDIIGKTVLDVLPDTEKYWIEGYGKVALEGEPLFIENFSAGIGKYFEVTAYCPAPRQFATIFVDVTDEKIAEEELNKRINRLQLLQRLIISLQGIYDLGEIVKEIDTIIRKYLELDRASILLYDQEAGGLISDQLIGAPREDMISDVQPYNVGISGKAFSEDRIITIDDCMKSSLIPMNFVHKLELKSSVAIPLKTKGHKLGVLRLDYTKDYHQFDEDETSFFQLLGDEAGILIWNAMLYTQQQQTNAKLQESEYKFKSLVDQAAEMLFLHDTEGNIIEVNRAAIENTGYSRNELCNMNVMDIDPDVIKRDDLKNYWKTLRPDSAPVTFESRHQRKDGTIYPAEVTIAVVQLKDEKLLLALSRNITERKEAEAQQLKLREQLMQAQKMESVGRLAGGVAHDFNNMLMVIMGQAELAMGKISPDDKLYSYLVEINKAGERSANLTRQLLAFARRQTIQPRIVNLNDVVADMLKMLRRLVGENIDLVWQPGSGVWPVRVDPAQIDQILANLSVNARDAISGSGYLILRTANITIDELYCTNHSECKPGDYVQLIVSDTGCGMSKDTLDHLFEPFFTTKAMGEGTGLGLSTVYGIVKQNKGHISVYSEPDMGTSFSVFFPRYYEGIRTVEKPTKKENILGGNETILLVEDEAAILHLNHELLNDLGYTVIKALSPDEAIKKATAFEGKIHLLITDVIMPGMNGRQMAEQLTQKRPDMKVIYMSGYTADVIARHGVLDKGVYFIQKPFTKATLAKKIRQAINDIEDED